MKSTVPGSAPPCTNIWDEMSNRRAFGAEKSPENADSLDECKRMCLADETCVSLDYNESDDDHTCWLFLGEDKDTSYGRGIVHAILEERCPDTISTTPGMSLLHAS